MCPLLSIFGLVLAHKAQYRIRRSNGRLGGQGKALAGLITGYIGLVLGVVGVPLLAAILVPSVMKVHVHTKNADLKSNGKNLYITVYADAIDDNVVGFPEKGKFQTSTDYFKALAGDNPKGVKVLPTTPDYIAGPHAKPATEWSSLQADNVGWCIVAGVDVDTEVGTPFLISSNIKARTLSELKGPIGDQIVESRLGNKVVVAYVGGGAEILSAKDLWQNAGDWPDAKILHP